ncbi:hypothetical protein HK405_003307, partial [Cladochytrium tenue]
KYSRDSHSVMIYNLPSNQLHVNLSNYGIFRPGLYEPLSTVEPEVVRIGSYRSQRFAGPKYLPFPS